MVKKESILLLGLIFSSSCTTYWSHPTKSSADLQTDYTSCRNTAISQANATYPRMAPQFTGYSGNIDINGNISMYPSYARDPNENLKGSLRNLMIVQGTEGCLQNFGWSKDKKK